VIFVLYCIEMTRTPIRFMPWMFRRLNSLSPGYFNTIQYKNL